MENRNRTECLKRTITVLLCLVMVLQMIGCRRQEENEPAMVATEAQDAISQSAEAGEEHDYDNALSDPESMSIGLDPKQTNRLSQVNCHFDDGRYMQQNFSYNEDGLLTTYETNHSSGSGDIQYVYHFSYNDNRQLIRCQEAGNSYPEREYYYNDDGILTGWSWWEVTGWQTEYYTEYNEQGQRCRDSSADGSNSIEYVYDSAGRLASKIAHENYGDMSGTSESKFTYDAEGRLAKISTISNWGWGDTVETYQYCYDYDPCVLMEAYNDDGYMYSILFLEDSPVENLVQFPVDDTAAYEMENGHLRKVIGADYTFEFFYDGEASEVSDDNGAVSVKSSEWAKAYYDFIVEDKRAAADQDNWDGVTYELIYLDGDNVPELWIGYQYDASGCRLANYQDGKVLSDSLGAGYLTYTEYENIFVHSSGHQVAFSDTVYTLSNGSLKTVAEGQYTYETQTPNYTWNGADVFEQVYTANINNYVDPQTAKHTASGMVYVYEGILNYLQTFINK